jgi:hypothetical protein
MAHHARGTVRLTPGEHAADEVLGGAQVPVELLHPDRQLLRAVAGERAVVGVRVLGEDLEQVVVGTVVDGPRVAGQQVARQVGELHVGGA